MWYQSQMTTIEKLVAIFTFITRNVFDLPDLSPATSEFMSCDYLSTSNDSSKLQFKKTCLERLPLPFKDPDIPYIYPNETGVQEIRKQVREGIGVGVGSTLGSPRKNVVIRPMAYRLPRPRVRERG